MIAVMGVLAAPSVADFRTIRQVSFWHKGEVLRINGKVRYRREFGPDAGIAEFPPLTQGGRSIGLLGVERQRSLISTGPQLASARAG